MCLFNRCSKWSSGTCRWDTCQSFAFDQETSWNINFINFINFILYSTSLISSTFGEAWWGQPTKWVKSWDKQDTKTRQENDHSMTAQMTSTHIKNYQNQKHPETLWWNESNRNQFTSVHSISLWNILENILEQPPCKAGAQILESSLSRPESVCRIL